MVKVSLSIPRRVVKPWVPPNPGVVKCNFDASFNINTFRSVSRINFRNDEGRIMVACTYQNSHIADAMIMETKAYLQAITVAEELEFRNLTLEGDCLTVTKKIKETIMDRSSITVLI